MLLDRHTPASVAIDRHSHIVYFHGKTDDYLSHPAGEPTRELMPLVREPIRGAVRTAIQKALADNQPHTIRDGTIDTPEGRQRIIVTAEPLDEKYAGGFLLVSFERQLESALESSGQAGINHNHGELEAELKRARDELQSTVEELQSSNEELRASNEEVMSVNEELQSSNEELETSKEELQSLNEELVTVNAQLQSKMEELESKTNDLSSLLTSTNIGVVFLDTQFRIRQFTPAISELIDLIPSDVGRPLRDLAKKFADPTLLNDCSEVLTRLVPRDAEILSEGGKYFTRRIHPYRTTDNRITGVVITFIDVSSRKQTEESLRSSEERMRLVIEDSQDFAIILLDNEGRISTWNTGAERLLGYTERQVVGQSGAFLLPPADREHEWAAELEMARTTGRASEDKWHVRKDGTEFWGIGVLHALFDSAGKPTGFVKILRDQSQRRLNDQIQSEALKTEQKGRLEAEWATGLRDRFLAVLSHELRTPLSAILLWSQMLRTQSLSDEQRTQGLDAIQRSAESQKELLNELLDSSRIASGKIHLASRPTDLRRLIELAVETIQPNASEKDITLAVDLSTPSDEVIVDPDRLQQVLMNLLTNAIKFTPQGGTVTVRLRTTRQDVHIEVEDTGRGIDADFLSRVFEPFSQQDTESVRLHGGLGLGLAISKQLVELHGGTLRATSGGRNQGATFHIRLPFARANTREKSNAKNAAPERDTLVRLPAGCRILLIEDDDATRQALSSLLEAAGATLTALPSGEKAVETFAHERPNLIVSDIGLPGEDGFSILRRIRTFEEKNGLPPTSAIALTAFAREDDQLQAIVAGFQQHIAKPVDGPALLRMIATHLGETLVEHE